MLLARPKRPGGLRQEVSTGGGNARVWFAADGPVSSATWPSAVRWRQLVCQSGRSEVDGSHPVLLEPALSGKKSLRRRGGSAKAGKMAGTDSICGFQRWSRSYRAATTVTDSERQQRADTTHDAHPPCRLFPLTLVVPRCGTRTQILQFCMVSSPTGCSRRDRRLRRIVLHESASPNDLRAFQTSSQGHCRAHSSVTNG